MAASDNNVPAQIRVVDGCSEAVGDLKDLLVNADAEEVPPAIHLVAWSGSCEDMLSLQKANSSCAVYVGFTAAIGFAKASRELKDCAFDCPLDKILLESDGPNAIPTAAVEFYGKGAFSHCGLVPFAGEGVAACRGASAGLSGVDIVNLASANMKTMFGPTVEGGEGERRGQRQDIILHILHIAAVCRSDRPCHRRAMRCGARWTASRMAVPAMAVRPFINDVI